MNVGDKVTMNGKEGVVQEVEWHGVSIHWPKAFGWWSGYTAYYRNNELEKWGIKKLEGVTA